MLLLFLAISVLLPVLGLLPPMARGRAFNGLFGIRMPDRTQVYLDRWDGVLAQELVEWWAAWLVAAMLAAAPVWALSTFTPLALASPILLVLAWHWRCTDWGRMQLEYLGWAAEWLHGQRTAPHEYTSLEDHAHRMVGGYEVFASTTPSQALVRLQHRFVLARALLFLLSLRLRTLTERSYQ